MEATRCAAMSSLVVRGRLERVVEDLPAALRWNPAPLDVEVVPVGVLEPAGESLEVLMQRGVCPRLASSCRDGEGSCRRNHGLLPRPARGRWASSAPTALVDVDVAVLELLVEADVVHLLERVVVGCADVD